MALRKGITSIAFALSLLGTSAVFAPPHAQASGATEARIRELIQSSEIVPIDYRQHVNIAERETKVLISVYKAPDAEQADCKIDAILMAEKVIEAAPATQLVQVYFYDLAAQDKVWQVDVPTSAVVAYAEGRMNKLEVIAAARLTSKPINTLASSYAGRSYKEIVARLGVLEGPAQDQRTLALVRIDDLKGQGKDTSEFQKQYLHIEDLTRRGDLLTMRHELRSLVAALDHANGDNDAVRDAKLQSMLRSGANPQ